MKNSTHQSRPVWSTVLSCAATLALAGTLSASPQYQWDFGTGVSPAIPVGGGGAQATIVPGSFATGWMLNNAILGTAQGIWDLGRNGTITVANPAGFVTASGQDRQITLRVVEYQDGSIYGQLAAVAVPGATLATTREITGSSADIGDWIIHETKWNVPAGTAVSSALITSAYNGSLVDSVVVEVGQVPAEPELSIRRAGPNNSRVEISWPASFSTMVLESSAGVDDSASWSPVNATVQVNGDVRSVTLDAVGAARFYRLKQP